MTRRVIFLLITLMLCHLIACGEMPEQYDTTQPNVVVYKETDAGELTLEILYPTNRVSRKNPTVMVLHGGGWVSGSKEQFYRELEPLCGKLRASGVTVVGVDYRLAIDGLTWRDCLADCEDALAYLIEHAGEYDIDTHNIGVVGYSAGAHLALLTAIETGDDVKLCVSLSGPTVMSCMEQSNYYSDTLEYYRQLAFSDSPSELMDASATARLGRRCKSEFLLVNGLADEVVKPVHAEALREEADTLGMTVELMLVEELTHSYYSFPELDALCEEIAAKIVQTMQ